MTFLKALEKVRPLIADGSRRYICFALSQAGYSKYRGRIQKQLGPHIIYERWLWHEYPETHSSMDREDFRAGRLQWIDYMIAQERKKLK
jgi:hypothetical protein